MLVNISDYIPTAIIDLRYTSPNNFTGQVVDTTTSAQILQPVAESLASVQNALNQDGYTLVIWSAYRSITVQNKLRAIVSDSNFVSEISNHSRGIAVDITLADSHRGTYLEMPTDFDDFSPAASPKAVEIPSIAIQHRDYLIRIMQHHHFRVNPNEWWHFDYLPLLDSPIISS